VIWQQLLLLLLLILLLLLMVMASIQQSTVLAEIPGKTGWADRQQHCPGDIAHCWRQQHQQQQ
jgi:hypothetical protein